MSYTNIGNIDLRSLRHIVALAQELNYTRAAEALGLTQSALSRSIQAFENDHEIKLFDRSRSGVQLTAAGHDVVRQATRILQDSDELGRQLQMTSQAQAGNIRYGMAPLSAKALLPATLPQLLSDAPQLHSSVAIRKTDALLALLTADEIEFFICSEGQVPDETQLRAVHIGWLSFSLLVRPGHPLLLRGKQPPADYPILIGDKLKKETSRRLSKIPWLAGPQHIIEDFSVAARVAEQTDAIWVTSVQAAIDEIDEGKLVELAISAKDIPPRVRLMMYSLSRRTLSPGAVKLQGLFQNQIVSLSKRVKKSHQHGG